MTLIHPSLPASLSLLLLTLPDYAASLPTRGNLRAVYLRKGPFSSPRRNIPKIPRKYSSQYREPLHPRSSFNDIISNLIGGGSSGRGLKAIDFDNILPPNPLAAKSWEELNNIVQNESETFGDFSETSRDPERDPCAQSRATVRLFDAPDGYEPEIILYRDSASWCPYCEKVWLMLEEKRIPYKINFVPMSCYGRKPQEFLQIQPSGGIPVAIIKGKVISESNDILSAIESLYPDQHPMVPAPGTDKYKSFQPFLRTERKIFGAWFQWLVTGFGEKEFINAADETNEALSKYKDGDYFLGSFSMVDCMYAPFLERMAASVPYYKGLIFRGNPRWSYINKWFDAMESRPSFKGIQSDYYTHCHDLPPQIGGAQFSGDHKRYTDEIDGHGDSWKLPLSQEGGLEPVRAEDRDQAKARRGAARALIDRHEAVAKFSTRPWGERGPGVSAPLADTYNKPQPKAEDSVDIALRLTAEFLLGSQETWDTETVKEKVKKANLNREMVTPCLEYLRDRVGVPRDMSFAEARQLRAHLNLLLDAL
ncbi:hypothetical protein AAMO2058_001321500 [Amorphochlora amoebiformis]